VNTLYGEMEDAVLRERLAKSVVLFTVLGLVVWAVRPLMVPLGRADLVTPWSFYAGLVCFAIALVALVSVIYLDETRELEPEERGPNRRPG
jgi:hypothetical protein